MNSKAKIVGIALLLIVAFWFLDTFVDLFLLPDRSFKEHLLFPTLQDISMRFLAGLALATSFILHRLSKRRDRKNQAALLQQKGFYESLIQNSPEGILVHHDGFIDFANSNARHLLQLEESEDSAGKALIDYVLPEYHRRINQVFNEVQSGKNPSPLEFKIKTPAGLILDIQASNSRINWEGRPSLVTFFRDISEDHQNRMDLLQSGERLRLALDAARDGAWDWDITTGKMVYSEAWAVMLGYSLDEFSDTLDIWGSLIHPNDLMAVQSMVDNHLQGFIPNYEIEVRLKHKQGHYIWVLDRGRVVEWDEQGNPRRMAGTHRNITSRKEAEIALEIRNLLAETLISADPENVFEEVLAVVCRQLDSPLGWFVNLDSHFRLEIAAIQSAIPDDGQILDSELVFEPDNLPPVYDQVINKSAFFLQNHPLELPGHGLALDSVVGVPITSRKQILGAIYLANKPGGYLNSDRLLLESLATYIAPILQSHRENQDKEAQLRQSQKMEALGSLAGGIAHDFNNILQAIMGFTTLALEAVGSEGNVPGDLQRVLKATNRGQNLVQRILLFSRREEQKHEPVVLETVVAEALNLLYPSIPSTIEIRSKLQAQNTTVLGDPGQISQIILNLATNAYHAMEPDGGLLEIELVTRQLPPKKLPTADNLQGKDVVVLTISDTGSGMSEEIKARLFDPFFTTKVVGKGTGLGMSVVHGIVKAHGGDIEIQSEPGLGTTVIVRLPVLADGVQPELFQHQQTPWAGVVSGQRVALVDDEKDITDIGKALLERRGFTVTCENSGRKLMAALEKKPDSFDVVITDLTMPEITGLQLADRLAKISPGLPLILITGMTEDHPIDLESHPNIRGLVRKPFSSDTLHLMVKTVLRASDQVNGL